MYKNNTRYCKILAPINFFIHDEFIIIMINNLIHDDSKNIL